MLYLDHFGLNEAPFRITPHTDFFFEEADRGATLAALVYAILNDEGIVRVTGEVGTGKTMLCRVLMERLPEHVSTIYLANPSLPREEILRAIADDLDLKFSEDRASVTLRELQDHLIGLYASGRRVVILIDEAHAMPDETLEQVRLLSNLESNRHKLLQIVMFGQPELDETLDKPSMRQLKDRITHSFRMRPLTPEEIARYLSFRMRAAGYRGPDVFAPSAAAAIAKGSGGLTRRVNVLADKALLAAFSDGTHAVGVKQARTAVRDSDFGKLIAPRKFTGWILATALAIGMLLLGMGLYIGYSLSEKGAQTQSLARVPQPAATPASDPLPQGNLGTGSAPPSTNPAAGEPGKAPNLASAPTQPGTNPVATAGGHAIQAPAKPEEATSSKPPAAKETAIAPTPGADRRFAAMTADAGPLLKARLAHTRRAVLETPDTAFSIELFSSPSPDPARLERFLARASALVPVDEILVFPLAKAQKNRVRVSFGSYPDRASAAKAVESLPAKYKESFGLEPRSFADLKADM